MTALLLKLLASSTRSSKQQDFWLLVGLFSVMFLQNLLEKPEEREIVQDHALSMVQCKVLKQLQLLEGRKFDDPDITDDIEYLNETLQTSVQDLRYSI